MFSSKILFISFLFFAIITIFYLIYVIYERRKTRQSLKEHLSLNKEVQHAQKRLDFFHLFSPFLYYRLDDQLNMKEDSLF